MQALGSSDVAGTVSLAFTAGSSVLRGTGALLGSSANLLTPSALLQGSGALLGSSSSTFIHSGVLSGLGAVAGSCGVTFTDSGNLLGAGRLLAASAVIITPSGFLDGTPVTPILGTALLSIAAGTSTLQGAGRPTAICALSVTASASAIASGALAAACGVVFAGAPTLGNAAAPDTSAIEYYRRFVLPRARQ